jgi:hypothetical protein
MLDGLMARANADPMLMRRARFLELEFALDLGDGPALVRVNRGQVSATAAGPAARPAFSIIGPREAWAEFAKPLPKPGYHHLMAMNENHHTRFEGDVYPLLVNLFFITGLLSKLRQGEAA